jgi:hypothetical protein
VGVGSSLEDVTCTVFTVTYSNIVVRAAVGVKVRRPERIGCAVLVLQLACGGKDGGNLKRATLQKPRRRPSGICGSNASLSAACSQWQRCTHAKCSDAALSRRCLTSSIAHPTVSARATAAAPSWSECAAAAAHCLPEASRLSMQALQVVALARNLQRKREGVFRCRCGRGFGRRGRQGVSILLLPRCVDESLVQGLAAAVAQSGSC